MRPAWNRTEFDDNILHDLYITKRLPGREISKQLKIGTGSIYRRLRELNIVRSNSEAHIGIRPSNFKGRYIDGQGYVNIHVAEDNHYFEMATYKRNGGGYIREHRLVMAKHLGRALGSAEVVHHKNSVKDDNRIENLELFPNQVEHHALTLVHTRIKELEEENKQLRAALKAVEA